MADVVVKDHIFNFMKSETVGEARTILGIPDWSYNNTKVISTDYVLTISDLGGLIIYDSPSDHFIDVPESINVDFFNVNIVQVGDGGLTFRISSGYGNGEIISYGDLFQTAGKGSPATILRYSNNKFLLTGILQ